jgi:hypothetical protein
MLSGRVVSIDTIIEMIYQDYGFEIVNKAEVAEWIWRSMATIGTPYPYEDKVKELVIVDYRSELPLDLYSITMIREQSTLTPLREMTDLLNRYNDESYSNVEEIIADYDPAYPSTYIDNIKEYYNTIVGTDVSSEFYTYKTQGNYIYFGIDIGVVEMQYKAIPIDIVTGMPTVPDNPVYIRGIVSFIAERLAFRMMLKNQISERKYEIIRQDYFFNAGAAKSACVMPDPSRMETLINRWKSTYLGPEHFDTYFQHLGSRD